ncbi:hypothetical protein RI129_001570 [Pyrocoelia pectoralis]|uniref:Fatty acid desaturase domain-containing protein n=1 Tax=Pyrocoelia pectoralis TaxID=417401 RepID=A0AAN7ZXF8_9COLE
MTTWSSISRSVDPEIAEAQPISKSTRPHTWKIVWRNVLIMALIYAGGLYGLYLFLFVSSWKTCIWTYVYGTISLQGVTAGTHRLWSHKAFKAKLPLKIILMICQTMAFQAHHKFSDTDADPHNAKRGFFFSHVGFLMVAKHEDVLSKRKTICMSDLESDAVVEFQKKYYGILVVFLCYLLPAAVPWYFWNETVWVSWFTAVMLRHCVSLNVTYSVNSFAHLWGSKPYDKCIYPSDNILVTLASYGEGWHNYHHVFPWDYKTSEFGNYPLNQTTMVIDFFAKIGWAYDLKTVSHKMIEERSKRTGDGTKYSHQDHSIWGWGDSDMTIEEVEDVKKYNKMKDNINESSDSQ